MFEFLGFGRNKESTPAAQRPPAAAESASAAPKNLDKQREMLRLALSAVLRRHGIPSQWIGCDITPLAQPAATEVLLTQLTLLHWHDALMHYAPALQDELFKEIHLFDHSVRAESFLFVWKFAPQSGHPTGPLPAPEFWTAPAQAPVAAPLPAAAIPAEPRPKFDLPKSALDDGDDDQGFPATQVRDRI